MRRLTFALLLACLVLVAGSSGSAAIAADAAADVKSIAACVPGGPCAHPLPVRIVIVTMFEIGNDTGDAPGEF